MARYSVDIQANLTGFEKLDAIDRQIKQMKNQSVKIDFDIKGLKSGDLSSAIDFTKAKLKIKQQTSALAKELQTSMKKATGVKLTDSQASNYASQYISQMQKEYTKIANAEKKYQSNIQKIRQKEASSYANPYTDAYQSIGKKSSTMTAMSQYYTNLEKEALKSQQIVQKIQKEINSGKFQYNNAKTDNFLSNYVGQNSEALNRLRTQYQEIQKLQSQLSSGELDNNGMISTYQKLNAEVEKLGYSMKQVSVESSKTLDVGVAERSANAVRKYANDNTRALKQYKLELQALEVAYSRITTQQEKIDLDNKFKALQSRISAEGLTGKSLLSDFSRALKQIGQFAGAYNLIRNIAFQVPQQMVQAVKDVNAAQIELTKVSDASSSELSNYWDQAADSAKKYGSTISDVISSTADWSRLGFGLEDSKVLSDMTTLYQKVGDNMTQESASSSLIKMFVAHS